MEKSKNLKELGVDVGVAIFAARTKSGLTQEKLADKMKTSQSALSAIENGSRLPSWTMLLRISKALGEDILVNIEI
jgi:transcriptional regulator with XRE-family HTH domain